MENLEARATRSYARLNNSSWRTWEKQNRLISRPAHRLLESLGCYQPIEQMTTKTWLQFNSLATATIPCYLMNSGAAELPGTVWISPNYFLAVLVLFISLFLGFFLFKWRPHIFFSSFVPTKFKLLPLPLMIVCTTWTQCLLRLLWENWHDFCRNVITKWMMVVSFVAMSWLWILMSSFLALLFEKLYYVYH